MIATIGNYGIQDLNMQAILAHIIKVLEDPIQVVRDAAVMGVEEISLILLFFLIFYLLFFTYIHIIIVLFLFS